MRVWRLAQRPFAAIDGEGARLYGGRWNRAGLAIVYCAINLSLAVLEVLVHLDVEVQEFPSDYVKIPIEVPRSVRLDRIDRLPDDLADTVEIGSRWFRTAKTVGLLVPSVVVPEERNLLLNPSHRDFPRLQVRTAQPFRFDPRLNLP
ncbi:MAG TPA: RES family NAD+ phosphorylase [Candidatus Binataceae bacterium]|nr:RES family NAD+ phosphorylase [Candidatus Binataceae bacterium]